MKFSDPNYHLLKSYFDILVVERSGTDNSVLIGPGHTVVSQGGIYTVLYEENEERGFVGHRFIIKEINDNRFKMQYNGLESTFSVASSAFEIGSDMHFRKDSFFHYWLARPEQDNLYHDYCNQESKFLFFGKVWPDSSGTDIYNIEFEGLKDFTLQAIPRHNRTVNIEEFLKVYWDQIHHEMYSMTKNIWSLLDAKEVDIRWLAYISSIYGIEISEDILNELPLREWVDNLPYLLKRIGTYNALYIVWKVFLSNTKNNLNVYERWGKWCVQNSVDLKDEFEDHNFLEFYNVQPSGGAGNHYYSRFAPSGYPSHIFDTPNDNCSVFKWNVGSSENYLLFKNNDLNCSVGDIKENEINVTGYDPTILTTKTMFLSAANPIYSGDFVHSVGVQMDSSVTSPSNIVFWALSNEDAQMFDHSGDYLSCSFEVSGGLRYFKLLEVDGGIHNSVSTSYSYGADVPYYLVIDRNGSNLRTRIYDSEERLSSDLLETITLPLSGIDNYSFLYSVNGRRITGHNEWYGKILGHYTDNVEFVESPTASGSNVLTPHYKVQVDLSTEPLGDVFGDESIISESVVNELIRNFEILRPVSKYADYEELISPLSTIDRTGDSVSLYPLTSNGYMNTFFTGSKFISAGSDIGGDDTFSYFQSFASKIWNVNHNLNSSYVLVQPWIIKGNSFQQAKVIKPDEITIVDNDNISLTFNESVRGIVSVASSASSGIGFIEEDYLLSPSASWIIDHNLNSNTPSGYSTPPGPVINHWKVNNNKVIPDINDITTQDLMTTTWSSSLSGASIVRRSDYIHTQNSPSSTWNVNHGLNSWVIVQCYDINTYEEIMPDEITFIDGDNITIKWSANTRGYAHIIQVFINQVSYSPYECDTTGLGICKDVLGYWKVGTGTSSSWNPFLENDLESPSTSGTYDLIEEDLNNIFVDFTVPNDFGDISITEVGLFNYLDQLLLYSRCSDLFKPEGVQCLFHYRITKLESSSSSSSSSSVSFSSSSSSVSSS